MGASIAARVSWATGIFWETGDISQLNLSTLSLISYSRSVYRQGNIVISSRFMSSYAGSIVSEIKIMSSIYQLEINFSLENRWLDFETSASKFPPSSLVCKLSQYLL